MSLSSIHNRFNFDLKAARRAGFKISFGQRTTSGPLLLVSGHAQIAAAISDLATLWQYSEIGIQGINGAPTTYIQTSSLISDPQIFVGFHLCGVPLFLGVKRATEGHIAMFGQTRTGKTTKCASIAYQASRIGCPVIIIGLKDLDPMLLASLKAGADSQSRMDKNRRRFSVPFRYVTMRPGTATGGCNFFDQESFDLPLWMRSGNLVQAILPGDGHADPVQRYYTLCAQELFLRTPWGRSPRELDSNIRGLKLNQENLRSTAGARHVVAQLAAIEQLNLPKNHPASVDLRWIIANGGAVYFDACFQDTGSIATANAGLFASAVISAKRRFNASRDFIIFLIIDEAQQFPLPFLKQIIEQCASSGIRVLMCCHNLSQLGEDWESISMTQARFIFGAVPGSKTEEHLRAIFGTKKEYPFTFSEQAGTTLNSSVTHTSGLAGGSISISSGVSESEQLGFGFSERDVPAWEPNDTLALNHDRELMVIQESPSAELAHWGPKAIVAQQGGLHISFDEVNRLTQEALSDTRNTIIPGAKAPRLAAPSELTPEMKEKRELWLGILASTAARIRDEITTPICKP